MDEADWTKAWEVGRAMTLEDAIAYALGDTEEQELPTTGGPPLGGPLALVATLTLIGSGVGALVLLRGGGAVS